MDPPLKPEESDCCNSGCNPCILDVYEQELNKYNNFIKNQQYVNVELVNAINTTVYKQFKLTERQQLSDCAFLLSFTYAVENSLFQTPNCLKYNSSQYFILRAKDYNGEFTRAYTPIPMIKNDALTFTILIKIYPEGRMSKILKKLQIGWKTSWRGAYGDFAIHSQYKHKLFIAQGTGIAPIFAAITEIVNDENCETFIKLFFCCRNTEEILLREELYTLSSFWNFSYEIFLSDCTKPVAKYGETINEHKLTINNIENYILDKLNHTQVVICGSTNFNESIQEATLSLGVEPKHIYLF